MKFYQAIFKNDGAKVAELISDGENPNLIHPESGNSVLQLACEMNSISALKALLDNGADPNLRFTKISRMDGRVIYKNSVALMHANSIEAAGLLIDSGAELDLKDDDGCTPLVYSAKRHNINLFEFLLSHGADLQIEVSVNGVAGSLLDLILEDLEFKRKAFGCNLTAKQIQYLDSLESMRSKLTDLNVVSFLK